MREHDFPNRKLVNDGYVHDLEKLLNISGVSQLHQAELKANKAFASNWTIVKDWSEERRYEHSIDEGVVRDFLSAVTDSTSGVLTWLKRYW